MRNLFLSAAISLMFISPALAESQGDNRVTMGQRKATIRETTTPAAVPKGSSERTRVLEALRRNPNAFGGFNLQSDLADIRAKSDRNRRDWMAKELARAKTPAQRAAIQAKHDKIWAKITANRVKRESIPLQDNIIHGLWMIYTTAKKAGG